LNDDKTVIYDPNPLDLELEIFGSFSSGNMDLKDLAKPEVVRFLVHNQRISLAKLKQSEKQIDSLQKQNSELIEHRENLRIQLAKRQEWDKATWLEIPISILSGFAINMLATNSSNGTGWLLLVMSLLMLIFLRVANLKNKSKDYLNEVKENG
jgi:hypothetical protein